MPLSTLRSNVATLKYGYNFPRGAFNSFSKCVTESKLFERCSFYQLFSRTNMGVNQQNHEILLYVPLDVIMFLRRFSVILSLEQPRVIFPS